MGLFERSPYVILAPMAGVSDAVFRQLALEQGADLAFTEMVSSKGLEYKSRNTFGLLTLSPLEARIAVQLFGHDPKTIASEALQVEEALGSRLFCIDINMGCPARKIVKKGDGSALMNEPHLAAEIITETKRAVASPVTCKFRRGFKVGEDTSLDFAKRMEDAGADAVCLHPRFAMQYYKGSADWDCIRALKQHLSIPVIGNGDIVSAQSALEMLDHTGCDHVMIARAAQGNPWIFRDIKLALEGKPNPMPVSAEERINAAIRHAKLLSETENENLVRMRRIAPMYLKGIKGVKEVRMKLNGCTAFEDFRDVLTECLSRQVCTSQPMEGGTDEAPPL